MKTFTKLRQHIADLFMAEPTWRVVQTALTGGAVIRDIEFEHCSNIVRIPVAALLAGQTVSQRCSACQRQFLLEITPEFLHRELGGFRSHALPGMSAVAMS